MGLEIGGIKLPNLGGWVNDRKKEAAAWVKDPGKEAGKTLAGAGKALVGESVKTLNNAKAWVKDPGAEAGKTLKRVGARVDRENKKAAATFNSAVQKTGKAYNGASKAAQNKASEAVNNAKAWAKDPGKEASKTLDRTGKNLISDAKQTAKNAKAWAKDPGKETSKTLERFQQTGIKLLNKLDKHVVGTLIKASQPNAKKTGPSAPPRNISPDSKLAQAEKRLNDYSSQYEKKAEGKSGIQKAMDGVRKITNEGYGDDQFKNIGKSKEELAALKTKVRDGSMTQAQADQASLAIVKKFNTEEKRVTEAQGNNAKLGQAVHGAGRMVVVGGAAVAGTVAGGGVNVVAGVAAAAAAGSLYDAASEMDKGSSAIAPKLDNSNSIGGVAVKAARGEKVNGGDVARGAFGTVTDAMSGLSAGNGVVVNKAAQLAVQQAALKTGAQVTRNQLAKAVVVATTKNTIVQTGAELGLKTAGIALDTSLTDKQKRKMVSENAMQTVKGLPVQLVTGSVSGYGGVALQLKKPVADVAAQLVFDGATNLAQASANNFINKGDARLTRDDIVVASIQAVGGAGQNIAGRVQMKPVPNASIQPVQPSRRNPTVQTTTTQSGVYQAPDAAGKTGQKLLAPGKNETQQIYGPDGKKIGSTYVANNGSITGTRGENNQVFSAGRPDYGVRMQMGGGDAALVNWAGNANDSSGMHPYASTALAKIPAHATGTTVIVGPYPTELLSPGANRVVNIEAVLSTKQILGTDWRSNALLQGAGDLHIYRTFDNRLSKQRMAIKIDPNKQVTVRQQDQVALNKLLEKAQLNVSIPLLKLEDETPANVLPMTSEDAKALLVMGTASSLGAGVKFVPAMATFARIRGDLSTTQPAAWLLHFFTGGGKAKILDQNQIDVLQKAFYSEEPDYFQLPDAINGEIRGKMSGGVTSGTIEQYVQHDPVSAPRIDGLYNMVGTYHPGTVYKGIWSVNEKNEVTFSGTKNFVVQDRYNWETPEFNGRTFTPPIPSIPSYVMELLPQSYIDAFKSNQNEVQRGQSFQNKQPGQPRPSSLQINDDMLGHLQMVKGGAQPFWTIGVSEPTAINNLRWQLRNNQR